MTKEVIKKARKTFICLGIRLKYVLMLVFLADEYVIFIKSRMLKKNCMSIIISKPTLSMVKHGIEMAKKDED